MSWEQLSAWCVEFSFGVVPLAVGLLLQSTVLLMLGLAAGRLVRSKGAAIQSSVYRTTLAAVILCPAASLLLDRVGMEGLFLGLPPVAQLSGHGTQPIVETRDVVISDPVPTVPVDIETSFSNEPLWDHVLAEESIVGPLPPPTETDEIAVFVSVILKRSSSSSQHSISALLKTLPLEQYA